MEGGGEESEGSSPSGPPPCQVATASAATVPWLVTPRPWLCVSAQHQARSTQVVHCHRQGLCVPAPGSGSWMLGATAVSNRALQSPPTPLRRPGGRLLPRIPLRPGCVPSQRPSSCLPYLPARRRSRTGRVVRPRCLPAKVRSQPQLGAAQLPLPTQGSRSGRSGRRASPAVPTGSLCPVPSLSTPAAFLLKRQTAVSLSLFPTMLYVPALWAMPCPFIPTRKR